MDTAQGSLLVVDDNAMNRDMLLGHLKIRTKFLLISAVAAGGMILLGGLSLKVLNIQKTLLLQVVHQDLSKIDELSTLFSQLSTTHVQIFDLLASAGRVRLL